MYRSGILAIFLSLGASFAFADSAAITQRQAILKTFGDAAKEPAAMLKGEAAFDLAKVQHLLHVLQEGAPKLKPLFPADSKSGNDTKALPAVWDKPEEFVARFDKLAADAKAAEALIKDEASFKSELPKVFGNCGGCHRSYRAQ